jgi:hypothetical protein
MHRIRGTPTINNEAEHLEEEARHKKSKKGIPTLPTKEETKKAKQLEEWACSNKVRR